MHPIFVAGEVLMRRVKVTCDKNELQREIKEAFANDNALVLESDNSKDEIMIWKNHIAIHFGIEVIIKDNKEEIIKLVDSIVESITEEGLIDEISSITIKNECKEPISIDMPAIKSRALHSEVCIEGNEYREVNIDHIIECNSREIVFKIKSKIGRIIISTKKNKNAYVVINGEYKGCKVNTIDVSNRDIEKVHFHNTKCEELRIDNCIEGSVGALEEKMIVSRAHMIYISNMKFKGKDYIRNLFVSWVAREESKAIIVADEEAYNKLSRDIGRQVKTTELSLKEIKEGLRKAERLGIDTPDNLKLILVKMES